MSLNSKKAHFYLTTFALLSQLMPFHISIIRRIMSGAIINVQTTWLEHVVVSLHNKYYSITVVLSDSLLAPNSPLWLNHNSGASSFPKTEPSKPFSVSFCLAAARRKQTITVSHRASQETSCALFSYPSSAPPQSPVIITGHRALAPPSSPPPPPSLHCFYFHSLALPPSCSYVRRESLLLSQTLSARLQPVFTRVQTLQENPLRSAPPLSVSCRPHSFMTPDRWRRRFHGAHCRRQ